MSLKGELARSENVDVSIHPIWRGYESAIKPSFAGWFTLTTYWKVLLANTSDRTISIVSYEVGELFDKDLIGNMEMDQGLVSLENIPINLPINLEPGQSLSIKAKVGLRVHHQMYEFVMKELGANQKFHIEELTQKLLRKRGIDFYNNDLTQHYMYLGYHDKVVPFPRDNAEQQYIALKGKTSRGSIYSSTSSWYEREALLTTPDIGMDRFDLERLRLNMPNE